jgi:hypothetical protein
VIGGKSSVAVVGGDSVNATQCVLRVDDARRVAIEPPRCRIDLRVQRHRLARRLAAQLPPIGVEPRGAREKSEARAVDDQVAAPCDSSRRTLMLPAVPCT